MNIPIFRSNTRVRKNNSDIFTALDVKVMWSTWAMILQCDSGDFGDSVSKS